MDRCTDILTKRTAGFPGSSVTQAALDDVGQIEGPVTELSTREYCGGHVYADGRLERTLPRPGLRTHFTASRSSSKHSENRSRTIFLAKCAGFVNFAVICGAVGRCAQQKRLRTPCFDVKYNLS